MEKSKGVIKSPNNDEETLGLYVSETPKNVNLSGVSIINNIEVQSDCNTTMVEFLETLSLSEVFNNNNPEVQSNCDTTMVEFEGNVNSETHGAETIDKLATSALCLKYRFCSPIDVVPNVPQTVLPTVGSRFQTLGHCIAMYQKYAEHAGFDIRKSTEKKFRDKSVKWKYLICHRAGVPNKRDVDTTDLSRRKVIRNSSFKVTNCKASVRFVRDNGTSSFKLYYFNPHHNHKLFEEHDMVLSRLKRRMKFSDKRIIHRAARANIGATKAHHLQVCLMGGYDKVGCSKTDYKNYKRDLDSFVGDGDVQMVVNMFNERVLNGTNFSFEVKVSDGKLQGLFWVDELSKSNYAEFGHVISFDATYKTNLHCMVFVPFLAIDNNRNSIVVGSGILCDETTPSYTWLLQAFLKVHKIQPKLVLTDQDATIKEAFPIVFTEAKHRLCMWHIMGKLPNRVDADILANTDFRKRLIKLVWSVFLGPKEFEVKWNDLMKEFNMESHPWLSLVYSIRSKWIPTYFKELPMCGLMKTTSRSESLNSFFKSFSHHGNDLLGFILAHDTAMDKQRNTQRIDEHETNSSIHHFKTKWLIEEHAAMVYTRSVFFDVQKQIIKADRYCAHWNVVSEDGYQKFTIRQKDKRFKMKAEYKVVFFEDESSFACSCQHFEYFGILCCHIFCVLFNTDVEEIPTRYISKRWMRGVIPSDVLRTRRLYSGNNEKTDKLINDIQFQFDNILSRIFCNEEKLEMFLQKVRSIKDEVVPDMPLDTVRKNKDIEFETMLGVPKPKTIDIRPPEGIRNKGCGTGKRLIGGGERAVKNARPKRKCRGCKELTNHDIRNCPFMKAGVADETHDD